MVAVVKLEVLPRNQRSLWGKLRPIQGQVLYGGTAIALRLGHRESVDFVFFSSEPLEVKALDEYVQELGDATLLRRTTETLEYSVDGVRLSFFGSLRFGRVEEPEVCDNGIVVASLLDLFGHKLKVVQQRAELKDYADIAAILEGGIPLECGLGAACALFPELNPQVSLRALSFIGDVQGMTEEQKRLLELCVSEIRDIVPASRISDSLHSREQCRQTKRKWQR